jgi:hypothetical protein
MKRARKPRAEWVVAGGNSEEAAHCTRCGEGLVLGTQRLDVFLAATDAFIKAHLHCKEGEYHPPVPGSLHEWARSRDTGTSSLTIYSIVTGVPSPHGRYDVPHDPADFGRCYRFLKLFPDCIEALPIVAQRVPQWVPFVREWDRLTAMYEAALAGDSGQGMYDFMKTLEKEAGAQ